MSQAQSFFFEVSHEEVASFDVETKFKLLVDLLNVCENYGLLLLGEEK